MRYMVLATDYDGTIAHDGVVDEQTLTALRRVRDSGRKLVLVTGRILPDLLATFPGIEHFDSAVVENGALLYDPATKQEKVLTEPPEESFLEALRRADVKPLSIGHGIVATWDDQKEKVLQVIQNLGLERHIIFNKGALMVLPSGVNKATGLKCALEGMGFSAHNAVGIGDAENDHAFLSACECAGAVANALPALKERADIVTEGARGAGVQELVSMLLDEDLAFVADRLTRHDILIGSLGEQRELRVPAYGSSFLVAGTSGRGKSTLTTGFMERLNENKYQFCAIDPEGDYHSFPGAVVIGDPKHAPTVPEIEALLAKPEQNVIVNLLGVRLEQRPNYFQSLLPKLLEMRAHTGRPHWIVIDEAHHVLPAERGQAASVVPKDFTGFMLITMEPDHLDRTVTGAIERVIAVGEAPDQTIRKSAEVCGGKAEYAPAGKLEKGQALAWWRKGGPVERFEVAPSSVVDARHRRKYATAELSPDRSFYFRGPDGKLKLRAQNLMIFLQTMEGVDDETWLYHFRRGEYSKWFREAIQNDDLAEAAAEVEKQQDLSAEEGRQRIREEIEERYTLPA
jgi:HAD superfamily hydrolase (TIGR01484 family)